MMPDLLSADVGTMTTKIPAEHQSRGLDRETGTLPVWIDNDGRLRIALRVDDPQHAHDITQIIVDVSALLRGIGLALDNAPPITKCDHG